MSEANREKDDESVLLYSKEEIVLRKRNKKYTLSLNLKNKNIFIQKIIDFNFVKLIYDLNNDIYEKVSLSQINDKEATLFILIKNLFDDLGIPQQYIYGNLRRYNETPNNINFSLSIIKERNIDEIPDEAEQKLIENITYNCEVLTPHDIQLHIEFELFHMLPFVEKMITNIIIKMFKRLKLFVESIKI